MSRKATKKMQLFVLKDGIIIDKSDPGVISDKAARAMIDRQGPGEYEIVTGRIRKAVLSKREVTEFTLE